MFDHIREDVRSVFHRDPAARHFLEVILTYPGLHALLMHRGAHWCWKHRLKLLARLISMFSRWATGIEIHPGAVIGRRFFIDHGMGVVIGETAEVGDDVTIYHSVTLGGTTWNKGKRHPTLADGVVIGAGAKVLGPVQVGKNSRIGSNSVVTRDVPENATVVGIPGRVINKPDSPEEERRRAMAEKIGFSAYGVADDMPDPVADAIRVLLDQMHAVDTKIDSMCEALARQGIQGCGEALPTMDEEAFDPVTDEPHSD